jgi:hypothetical protein
MAVAEEAGVPVDSNSDIARTARLFDERDGRGPREPAPSGQLRHMVGIQYYFDEDINWRDGHYYMPLSAWGLTAISQVRFWQDRHDWEHGYRGVLSVVFTVMDQKGIRSAKTAWASRPEEIAAEIWKQVKDSLSTQNLPEPRYWHLDWNLEPSKEQKENKGKDWKGYENTSPLLVNLPGKWEDRPGDLAQVVPDRLLRAKKISRYSVDHGVVLAGTYMKTYTRLTTMEAANESARHAVNAVIQHSAELHDRPATRLTPCDIWPIEQREVDDLGFFKELDKELYARKLQHLVEILDLDTLARTGLRGARPGIRDPFDPLSILTQLDRLLRSYGKKVTDAVRAETVERKVNP